MSAIETRWVRLAARIVDEVMDALHESAVCGAQDPAGETTCPLPAGHPGSHEDWLDHLQPDPRGPKTWLTTTPATILEFSHPQRWEIPGQPPTGTRVRTLRVIGGTEAQFSSDEAWEAFVASQTYELERDRGGDWRYVKTPQGEEQLLGAMLAWITLLQRHGTVEEIPETPEDPEITRLYGPRGARWGDPNSPCRWTGHTSADLEQVARCALGTGHVGPHVDAEGNTLGMVEPSLDLPPIRAGAFHETLCTCAHPANHDPSCPRYASAYGRGGDPLGHDHNN